MNAHSQLKMLGDGAGDDTRDCGQRVGQAVDEKHLRVVLGFVVVGEQARVDDPVDDPAESGQEPHEHEQPHGGDDAGEHAHGRPTAAR